MKPVKKAVITAAGRGTRQYPATSVIQKEMLPLVDRDGLTKPVIQIIAEEALDSGVEQICIVVSPGDEAQFRQYFRAMEKDLLPAFAGKEWAIQESAKLGRMQEAMHFVVQDSPQGYGHAVHQAAQFVGDDPFLLLLGDHIYISGEPQRCAQQLMHAYQQAESPAISAVKATPAGLLHLFGAMKGAPLNDGSRLYRVELIREKPSVDFARQHLVTPGLPPNQYLCHFGMHVFPPAIMEILGRNIRNNIRENKEIQLTNAQEMLRQEISNYDCFEVLGERYDTGIPFGLMETQIALALAGVHRQQIVESLARLLTQQLATVKKQ